METREREKKELRARGQPCFSNFSWINIQRSPKKYPDIESGSCDIIVGKSESFIANY